MNEEEIVSIQRDSDILILEEDIELTGSLESVQNIEDFENAGWKEIDLAQWNLQALNLPEEEVYNSQPISIAILDSGVSYTEEIDVVERKCFISGEEISPLWEDATGHGTAIAGLIGAKDNGEGIMGVNPSADLYSLRVLNTNNKTSVSKVVAGIYWAIENDISILNMSFGTSVDSIILHNAIIDAYNAGILMIAAAGTIKQ